MASEAFKPITTIQEPSIQGMPRFYVSTREVAAEWEPPVRGSVVGTILGSRFKLHIVLDATVQPSQGKLIAAITHCSPAAWTILLNTVDRDGLDVFLLQRQVVPTPTQSDVESAHLSTFEPIDEAKSLKITKVPRRRTTSNTFEDGYPQKQKKSKGIESLVPQKFKRQTKTTITTTQETLAAADVNGIPDPSTPAGDQTLIEHEKVTDHRYERRITTETIDVNAATLVSPSLEDQLYVTTEILVAEGSQPDNGTGVIESAVQAIGDGKAVKTTKFACTAYTNKTTYTVGYATLLNEQVGTADVIPAKFRALKNLKTWRFRVQTSAPPTAPALGTGTGSYSGYDIVERATKQTQENGATDVFEVVVVGLSNTGSNALDITTYGKIVTTTTTETLDLAAQTIDTGLAIIASTVEALGNGMTLKSTEQVQGGTWPNPVEREIVSDATRQPPARYLRDLIRTTLKRMVGSAGSGTLSGSEVAKSYKRITPDRLEESITTETLTLSTTAIDEDVQQKPYVTITSVMTPGAEKVIPPDRNGSAKLVYEQGTTQIWENTEEVAVAREGAAGSEKDTKPFVQIVTDKRYSTANTVNTSSGGANIIFNDGTVQIYEISEITSTGRYGSSGTEQQTRPFVKITSTGTYQADGTLAGSEVGSTNKIYDDGTTTVYEKKVETAVAREGPSGTEKDTKPFVTIDTAKKYSASPTIATLTGSSNVVFNDGSVQVYEVSEVTSTGRYGPAGAEQQVKPFVKITSAKDYTATGSLPDGAVGSSNKIYDDGETEVYEQSIETAVAVESNAGTEKDEKPYVSIVTDKRYSADSTIATATGSANVVFNDGTVQVYEINEVTSTGKFGASGVEQQTRPFVRITSTGTYQADGTISSEEVGSTNKIYDDGTTVVYEKKVETAVAREGPSGTEKDEKPFVRITTDKRYSADSSIATTTGSANVVFNDGSVQVYEISEVESEGKYGAAGVEQQAKPYVKITSSKTYSASGELAEGQVGSSNKIYDDGTTTVYEKSVETAVAREGAAGTEKDKKPYVSITTDKRYSSTPEIDTTTGSSNVIFNDGTTQVYEINEIESTGRYGSSGTEQQARPYVKITTESSYQMDGQLGGSIGSTNKIYDDGTTTVYEKKVETAVAKPGAAGADKDKKPYVSITTRKRYSTSPEITTETGSSNVVFNDGSVQVYEVGEVTSTGRYGPAGAEQQAKPYVKITTNKKYAPTGTLNRGEIGSSNKIYDDGTTEVYEKSIETATAVEDLAGTEKDEKPYVTIATDKRYSISNSVDTPTGSSNLIFSDGSTKVYEVNENRATAKPGPAGNEKEQRLGYRLEHRDTYETSDEVEDGIGETVIAYTDGEVTVWKKRVTTVVLLDKELIVDKKRTRFYERTVTAKYSASSDSPEDIYTVEVVFSDGNVTIYKIESVQVIPLGSHTYDSYVRADRPSVLTDFVWSEVGKKEEWLQSHNDRDLYLIKPAITEGYSGLFPAKIKEYFTTDETVAASFVPVIFNPEPIHYDGLKYNVSVGPTLHEAWTLIDEITEIELGPTPDPMYPYGASPTSDYRTFLATVPTSVPSGYVNFTIDVEPFENGYIVREIKVKYKD